MGVISNFRHVMLCFFFLALVSGPGKISLVSAQCQGDLPGLMNQCSKYVSKSSPKFAPSKQCCDVVKTADVACACKYITEEVEKIISMEKVVYVARYCGKNISPGTKCGSYTVPPGSLWSYEDKRKVMKPRA